MVERQKPAPQTRESIWQDESNEEVTLPDRAQMHARLREALARPDELEEKFFPMLLKYAGERVLVSQVPRILLDALSEYTKDGRSNLRHYVATDAPSIIDAMITDPQMQKKAREFLASAING